MSLSYSINNLSRQNFKLTNGHHGMNHISSFKSLPPEDMIATYGNGTMSVDQDFFKNVGERHYLVWSTLALPLPPIKTPYGNVPLGWGIRVENHSKVTWFGERPDWYYSYVSPNGMKGWTLRDDDDRATPFTLEVFDDFDVEFTPTSTHSSISVSCKIINKKIKR